MAILRGAAAPMTRLPPLPPHERPMWSGVYRTVALSFLGRVGL